MSSVAQVALGILILGEAFVFGSHIRSLNRDNSVASENALESSADRDLVWQRPEQNSSRQQPANDSGGLIDLPVAKRRVAAEKDKPAAQSLAKEPAPKIDLPEAEQISLTKPDAPAPNPDEIHVANAIQIVEVEPDFSELEMNFARGQTDVPASDLTGIAQRMEFAPVKPLYISVDRDRVESREGNSLGVTKMRSLAPPESGQHRLVEPENSTPFVARKIPPIDPNMVTRKVRPRVPLGLTPQAKSRLVRLSSARSNRIQLETKEFVNHLAEAGESLHLLSEKYYGTPDYYLDIYLANQDVLDNPARVPAGTPLRIPLYK